MKNLRCILGRHVWVLYAVKDLHIGSEEFLSVLECTRCGQVRIPAGSRRDR